MTFCLVGAIFFVKVSNALDRKLLDNYPLLLDCVNFHGHLCPGLSLGYKASVFAISVLRGRKSRDEEIVAIVENDSCFVDAVQVITGCTFGKGNLIFRDYGKMVLVLMSRESGRGIRVSLKNPISPPDEGLNVILQKGAQASEEEKLLIDDYREKKAIEILNSPFEKIFSVMEINLDPPPYARIFRSERCEICSEPVMAKRLVEVDGKRVCIPCSLSQKR